MATTSQRREKRDGDVSPTFVLGMLCFALPSSLQFSAGVAAPCPPCSLCVCLSAGVFVCLSVSLSVSWSLSVCPQEVEWVDGMKECSCSCHEGSSDLKLKKSKRRSCSHCSSKVSGEGRGGRRGRWNPPCCDHPGAWCLLNNGVRKGINAKMPSGASLPGALTAPARPCPISLLLTLYCPSLLC